MHLLNICGIAEEIKMYWNYLINLELEWSSLKFFNVVLMSNECKTNAYIEGLKLKKSEDMIIRPACVSQTSSV